MSAQPVERSVAERQDGTEPGTDPGTGPGAERGERGDLGHEVAAAPQPVEVRRNAVVSGLIGAAAAAMATAYLGRAVSGGGFLDWLLCGLLAVLAGGFLRGLLDARLPLLVADELGVRIRFGPDWRGVPWEAVDRVVVSPRRGLLRDGRLVVNLLDVTRSTEGLDTRALRHAQLNRRLYGAPLAVPLGMTTRVSGEGDVGERVAALSHGRTEVVTLLDTPGQVVRPEVAVVSGGDHGGAADDAGAGEDTTVGEDDRPVDHTGRADPTAATAHVEVADPSSPFARGGGRRSRRTAPFRVVDAVDAVTAVVGAGDEPQPRGDRRVRRIAELREPIEPVVIEEFEPQPAYDPVIGPELAAARSRVGLSVDELAERTRIRPHVIESIEVDDFAPCGGDFYARGHIRTLARVLGKDPAPMLAHFDKRYATAPVSARRVFEAELATGMTGTVRGGGLGGPNWPLLVGAVLVLVLVWSGVRLFAGEGKEVLETPPPVLSGSTELAGGFGAPTAPEVEPVAVTVRAGAGASVEVRDGEGELVFEGDLVLGESKRLEAVPPLTVSADDGAAVSVVLDGRSRGAVGPEGQPGTRVFQAPVD